MAEKPELASPVSHWNAYCARFQLVRPPLRPCPADVEYLRESVTRLYRRQLEIGPALLLGVTPEIASISWEPPLELLAIDKSEAMVRAVWPGDTSTRRALVGDWLELAAPPGGFGLVMGDGVFSIFDYPAGYAKLGARLACLLRPGGLLSIRLFCRPEPPESLDRVFAELESRRIGNFHVFKWRLAMALQGDRTRGVRLGDIWDAFRARVPSIPSLAEHCGWPEPEVATIEGYRSVHDSYSFSSEAEVIASLSPAFELLETWRPSYELGERCPHLTFRRRA